ncbi:MAG: hypothetical protein JWN32_1483 [Solirubrobacterales bacterium]|nr:hypothetical protein [Solirubrobacterales bacterium]
MRPGLRPRPTYASVTATLALFVALGGGAYAATALPANSVGSTQLRNNAVVTAKIKNDAVNGSKVRDRSLTGADVNVSSPAKVPSATNATPAAASAAVDKATYKTAAGTAAASSAANVATATCDSGQHVVGGGVKLDNPGIGVVNDSYPDAGNTAWTAHVGNGSNGSSAAPLKFTVYAICTTITTIG